MSSTTHLFQHFDPLENYCSQLLSIVSAYQKAKESREKKQLEDEFKVLAKQIPGLNADLFQKSFTPTVELAKIILQQNKSLNALNLTALTGPQKELLGSNQQKQADIHYFTVVEEDAKNFPENKIGIQAITDPAERKQFADELKDIFSEFKKSSGEHNLFRMKGSPASFAAYNKIHDAIVEELGIQQTTKKVNGKTYKMMALTVPIQQEFNKRLSSALAKAGLTVIHLPPNNFTSKSTDDNTPASTATKPLRRYS